MTDTTPGDWIDVDDADADIGVEDAESFRTTTIVGKRAVEILISGLRAMIDRGGVAVSFVSDLEDRCRDAFGEAWPAPGSTDGPPPNWEPTEAPEGVVTNSPPDERSKRQTPLNVVVTKPLEWPCGGDNGSALVGEFMAANRAAVARAAELDAIRRRAAGGPHCDGCDRPAGSRNRGHSPDVCPVVWDGHAKIDDIRTLLAALDERDERAPGALRALVGALTSCEACDSAPATNETPGGFCACDEHRSPDSADLPWAEELRRAIRVCAGQTTDDDPDGHAADDSENAKLGR